MGRVGRRQFLIATGAFFAAPLAAEAQQVKVHRVGFIATTSPVSELVSVNPAARGFARGMRERGYVEGRNLVMEWRSAEGKFERFADIIQELVSIKVDVIVTVTNQMTRAAKEMTRTVPIVMAASTIPAEEGLVQSLARPGGNVTGFTLDAGPEIFAKRVQLLLEISPGISLVAVLGIKAGLEGWGQQDAEVAVRAMGTKLLFVEPIPTQYADAFAYITRQGADALLVAQSAPNYANRNLIAEFAAKSRLPALYPAHDYVNAGGLISYGVDISEVFRRAAGYVDRILKGTKPADLPVERPTKFELVINLKTAKTIGLTIPPSLLLRADRVIE